MEEREAMTVLTLGTGASSEHSKSSRSSVCEPKLPVQFHDLFCAQSLEEKDSIFVKMEKECNIGKKSRCRSLEDQEDSDSSNGQARKKLRLNEEQLTVLETVYKQHSNIDPAVKQELAEQLTIKPRQVEVWFQNRRARSKQKQTEADRENLKRWCEGLNNENQRLKRELQELMSVSHTSSLPLHDKAHNGSNVDIICSPCNKIVKKYSQSQ